MHNFSALFLVFIQKMFNLPKGHPMSKHQLQPFISFI
jgi:hypothetical protein